MRALYPPIKPYYNKLLKVSDDHEIYIEQSGNPQGMPLLIVHGGPGLGASRDERRFADPEKFRIIIFDQRGCGRSKPHTDITNNNTYYVTQDIETIVNFLKIDNFILFCHHWGIVPSLSYASKFAKKVVKIIVSGAFFARDQDLDWLFYKGANLIFPDQFREFISLTENNPNELLVDYYQKLFGDNEIVRMDIAKHWLRWWQSLSNININSDKTHTNTDTHLALSLACLQSYFFNNHKVASIAELLNDSKLQIPICIIHGRLDLISPVSNAFELEQYCEQPYISIIPNGTSCLYEPGITDAIIHSINI